MAYTIGYVSCHGAALAGLDPQRWQLCEGSATYGGPFYIWERDPSTGAFSRPSALYDNALGLTRRDAERTLDGMRAAWLAVPVGRREAVEAP